MEPLRLSTSSSSSKTQLKSADIRCIMRISQAFVAIVLATGVKSVPQGLPGDDWNLPGIPLSLFMNEGTYPHLFVSSRSANQILAAPVDMPSDNARNLLTSGSVHQIARTDYLPQTGCSDGETAAPVRWGKIQGKISQKPSGEMCLLDEAPIICPRGGGLTLRKKIPSCCAGPETVESYPYGGRISSTARCECIAHIRCIVSSRPKLISVSHRFFRHSEFCFVQKKEGKCILL